MLRRVRMISFYCLRQEVSLHNSLPKPAVMTSTQRGLQNLNQIVVEQLKSLNQHSTAQVKCKYF